MNPRIRFLAFTLALAALPGHASSAQDAGTLKDLTAVIMLLGMPCGQVTTAQREGDNVHIATCENGAHYRISLDAQGRVVADRL